MPPLRELWPMSAVDLRDLEREFSENGIKTNKAYSVLNGIVQQKVSSFREIVGLPQKAYSLLESKFALLTSKVIDVQQTSKRDCFDGKLVIKLQDGKLVETVVIAHFKPKRCDDSEEVAFNVNEPTDDMIYGHSTVCVSSQIGCAEGCRFCATGTMGLLGNLTCGEILEQLVHANVYVSRYGGHAVRNCVFMGMGEPMMNYDNVIAAISGMVSSHGFRMPYGSVSVSTVGVIHRIRQFAIDCPTISLALSLHASNHDTRLRLVPSGSAYKFVDLIDSVEYYCTTTKRSIMIEYILIGGVNDSSQDALELAEVFNTHPNIKCIINVIPYNRTAVGDTHGYNTPTDEAINNFQSIVTVNCKHKVFVRRSSSKGREVDGACGQLALKNLKKNCCDDGGGEEKKMVDIEDIVSRGDVTAKKAKMKTPVVIVDDDETVAKPIEEKKNSYSVSLIDVMGAVFVLVGLSLLMLINR